MVHALEHGDGPIEEVVDFDVGFRRAGAHDASDLPARMTRGPLKETGFITSSSVSRSRVQALAVDLVDREHHQRPRFFRGPIAARTWARWAGVTPPCRVSTGNAAVGQLWQR